MKTNELRERSVEELKRRLLETKKEMMAFRFQKATGELTNTSVIRNARRTVARIKTLVNEKAKS